MKDKTLKPEPYGKGVTLVREKARYLPESFDECAQVKVDGLDGVWAVAPSEWFSTRKTRKAK